MYIYIYIYTHISWKLESLFACEHPSRKHISNQMQLVSSDGLPIATESRVEMWNAWGRGGCSTRGRFTLGIPARVCECGCVRARCISRDALSCAFLRFFLPRACTWGLSLLLPRLGYGYTYTRTLAFSLSRSLSLSPPSLVFPLPLTCSLVLARSLACARVEAVPPVRRAPRCCRLVVPLLFDEYLVSELQLSVAQRFSTASYVPDDSPTRTLCKTTAWFSLMDRSAWIGSQSERYPIGSHVAALLCDQRFIR